MSRYKQCRVKSDRNLLVEAHATTSATYVARAEMSWLTMARPIKSKAEANNSFDGSLDADASIKRRKSCGIISCKPMPVSNSSASNATFGHWNFKYLQSMFQ